MERRGKLADPKGFELKPPAKSGLKFSVEKAHAMQTRLAKQIIREDRLPEKIRSVAGVDVAYVGDLSIGAVAVLDYDSLSLIEAHVAYIKTSFPYIPTLLSFREVRPSLAAIKKLETEPDVLLVDGHGVAHPYRLGFASHLGLVIDKPTIGVAKSILCGKTERKTCGEWTPLIDRGEMIGAAIVTRRGQKPVYVSVGHKVSLERAIEIVKHCTRDHRIPEPILTAHQMADKEKRKYQ